jgi:uncharacterized protein HemX
MNTQPAKSPAAAPPAIELKPPRPQARRPWPWAMTVAILALGSSLSLGLLGWWYAQQEAAGEADQTSRLGQLQDRQRALAARLTDLDAAIDDRLDGIAHEQARLAAGQADVQAALDPVRVFAAKGPEAWVLAEVAYLMRAANHRLALYRDPATAATALEAADRRLRELADPAFMPVHEALAKEIEALRSLPKVDVAGMASTLADLSDGIATLPLRMTLDTDPASGPAGRSGGAMGQTGWARTVDDIRQGLLGLIRVRRHDRPVEALLAPKERFFLVENLRLRLLAARVALLHRDQAGFRRDLTAALQWTERYFDADSPQAHRLQSTLGELIATEIARPLPDITASLGRLQAILTATARQVQSPEDGP